MAAQLHKTTSKNYALETKREYSVVSLFSGCGGLDLGFIGGFKYLGRTYERLPFNIDWANDINAAACETYRLNLRGEIHCGDIWSSFDNMPDRADIVVGGFPCQDISINGNKKGIAGNRSGLYRAMVEAVRKCKPKIFVAENVKGLLLSYNKDSITTILADFASLGYNVTYKLYLAADYGVPQMRERVFIVGTAPGIKAFDPPKAERTKENWLTSKDAISDLEGIAELPAINHIWSRANKSPDQGNRIIKANKPSDTIRAECHGNIQYHYSLPRRLSMREAARIQSFPDNFVFAAKLRETERQVGNAVPPVLGWHIAKAVYECLSISPNGSSTI